MDVPLLSIGFRREVATAAFQIEGAADTGGHGTGIRDTFDSVDRLTVDGDSGDIARNHHHSCAANLDLALPQRARVREADRSQPLRGGQRLGVNRIDRFGERPALAGSRRHPALFASRKGNSMKRKFAGSLASVAVASLALSLAGCSADVSAGGAKTDVDGPLTVWVMGDSGENFESLVAPFVKESGQKVEVVAIPWDSIDEKLTTSVASGSGPDVLQIGLSKLRTFADAGALLPLDKLLGDHPALDPGNFPAGVGGEATSVNGEIVSVPWVSDTRVLFTRTDVLSENGIDAPPATWDELRADAKTLAGRGDGQYGYYIPQWDAPLPVEMTWSLGGDVIAADGTVDFDTPEFRKAVDLYTGLYSDGSVPTNGDFDQAQGFISGVAPMLVSGPYLGKAIADGAPELEGKWQASLLPAGTSSTSLFAGSNLGVWANTDQQDASLNLIEFLSQPENQLEWYSLTGELPAVTSALEDKELNSDPNVAVYTEQLATAKVLPLVSNWDGAVGAELLNALNAIALTGADRDKTLADFFAKTVDLSTE